MKSDTGTTPTAAPGEAAAAERGPAERGPADTAADSAASVNQIVQLADQLSACADQLHERIMRDIRSHKGKPIPEAQQEAARALLDDEAVLRQRANGLYADAATAIVKPLGKSQQHIIALTAEAAEKIRKIAVIGDVTGLVGGLLALAGAAASGQIGAVVAAVEKIHTHIKAIEANSAKKPT